MNRFEIRNILNSHKEHFRVLPTHAMNDLLGIIESVGGEVAPDVMLEQPTIEVIVKEKPAKKETPVESLTVGKVAKKKAKKKGK